MSDISEDMIKEAIDNCMWLSDNNWSGNLIKGICTGMCAPCQKCIDSGRCPTLKELFNKEDDGK